MSGEFRADNDPHASCRESGRSLWSVCVSRDEAEDVVRHLLSCLDARPRHWLGVSDLNAAAKARAFLGLVEEPVAVVEDRKCYCGNQYCVECGLKDPQS